MLEQLLHSSVNNVTCFRCILHMKKMLHLFPFSSHCFNPEAALTLFLINVNIYIRNFVYIGILFENVHQVSTTVYKHFILHFPLNNQSICFSYPLLHFTAFAFLSVLLLS